MPWTTETPLPDTRYALAAATCDAPAPESGSRVYAIGGYDASVKIYLTTVATYDPSTTSWSSNVPSMNHARGSHGATSNRGRLHALGGFDGYTALTTHEIYDPATGGGWSTAKNLPTARFGLAAVTGPDGLIYALGGYGTNLNYLGTVEAYDPVTDNWNALPPMPTPRTYLAAVTGPDGLIYAIGGFSPGGALDTVEIFDTAQKQWTTSQSPLPAASFGLAAAVDPNGLIYAFGGMDANANSIATMYSYDPTAAKSGWGNRAPLQAPQSFLAADTGPDGFVYAIGGYATEGPTLLDLVERYTFDKCDYIESEIDSVTNEIDDLVILLQDPELLPKSRSTVVKNIATLRARLKTLQTQLKKCRAS